MTTRVPLNPTTAITQTGRNTITKIPSLSKKAEALSTKKKHQQDNTNPSARSTKKHRQDNTNPSERPTKKHKQGNTNLSERPTKKHRQDNTNLSASPKKKCTAVKKPPTQKPNCELHKLVDAGLHKFADDILNQDILKKLGFNQDQITKIIRADLRPASKKASIDFLNSMPDDRVNKSVLEILNENQFNHESISNMMTIDGTIQALFSKVEDTTYLNKLLAEGIKQNDITRIMQVKGATGVLKYIFSNHKESTKTVIEILKDHGFNTFDIGDMLGKIGAHSLLKEFVPLTGSDNSKLKMLSDRNFEKKEIVNLVSRTGASTVVNWLFTEHQSKPNIDHLIVYGFNRDQLIQLTRFRYDARSAPQLKKLFSPDVGTKIEELQRNNITAEDFLKSLKIKKQAH